jgi:hypothetical protein
VATLAHITEHHFSPFLLMVKVEEHNSNRSVIMFSIVSFLGKNLITKTWMVIKTTAIPTKGIIPDLLIMLKH